MNIYKFNLARSGGNIKVAIKFVWPITSLITSINCSRHCFNYGKYQ